jgi:hypothetical protein
MKLQLRPSLLKIRRQTVKWIIVHHTAELYPQPAAKIDNSSFQTPELYKGVLEQKTGDINYHYVVEKIKEDYHPIVTRPFVYLCEWPDIPADINKRAIHVALLGSYDLKVPEKRLYQVLAFRLLNPMLKMFHLNVGKIKFHRDVSTDKKLTCPGDFMEMARVIALVRRYVVK